MAFLHIRQGGLLLLLCLLDRLGIKPGQKIKISGLVKLIYSAQERIIPLLVHPVRPDKKKSVIIEPSTGYQAIFFPFLSYSLDPKIIEEELFGDVEMLMAEGFVAYPRSGVVVLEKAHDFWANFFSTIRFADRIIVGYFASLIMILLEETK